MNERRNTLNFSVCKNMILGEKTDELIYICSTYDVGKKLLDVLQENMKISSRLIRKLKREKRIYVNGRGSVSINLSVRNNDKILVKLDLEENHFTCEKMDIKILYEDLDMLVIDKEPFKVVHPTRKHQENTIANGIAYLFKERGLNTKIRFINRLDRDTSGILLIAKNSYAQQIISNQMRENIVKKKYIALVHGVLEKEFDTIDLPIDREYEDSIRRCVKEGGQKSITHYKVIKRYNEFTLVEIVLETGRTHQIRVHFSHLNHPLVGDELYGGNSELFNRQALHGKEISFLSVREKKKITVISELPDDFRKLLEKI